MWWFRWKCNPLAWFWGIIPVALLALLAIWGEQERIQKDLTQRAGQALQSQGMMWAKPNFDGRDGLVLGEALSGQEKEEAKKIVNDVWGVRWVKDRTSLLTKISPYTWSATRKKRNINLTGYIPNESFRKNIASIAGARFPDLKLSDNLVVAPGDIEDDLLMDGIDFGLRQLDDLSDGRVSLSDEEFSVSGTAKTQKSYENIQQVLKTRLPDGLSLGVNDVVPPLANRYSLNATKTKSSLSVSGSMPNNRVMEDINDQIYGDNDLRVKSDLKLASGAPQNWYDTVRTSLIQLKKLDEGTLKINKRSVVLTGSIQNKARADEIRSIMKDALPKGYRAVVRLKNAGSVTIDTASRISNSNFNWAIQKRAKNILLQGYVASEDLRQRILEGVGDRFGGFSVTDRMKTAFGGPSVREQERLVEFSQDRLAQLQNGRVSVKGRNISISGAPSTTWNYNGLIDSWKSLPEGFGQGKFQVTPPRVDRFTWSVSREEDEVFLRGYVFNEAERKRLIGLAKNKFQGLQIIDEMELATGKPTGVNWLQGQRYALDQLARLKSGEVTLDGTRLRVEGEAGEANDFAAFNSAKNRVPTGFRQDEIVVRSPEISPYIWRADYQAGRVTLSGYITDENARREMKRFAEARFPDKVVTDRMENGAGGVRGWPKVAETSISQIVNLDRGSVTIWDNEVTIEGVAKTERDKSSIFSNIRRAGSRNFKFENKLRVEDFDETDDSFDANDFETRVRYDDSLSDADLDDETRLTAVSCETYLNTSMRRLQIKFQTASSRIASGSNPILRRLARIANRCPSAEIEVAGHTDSDGNEEFNKKLSVKRARSVTEQLVKMGVSAKRLVSVGYGESRPVAPNNSKRNKAKNRRIEFLARRMDRTE